MVSRASLVVAASAVAVLVSACTPAAAPTPSGPSTSGSPSVVSVTPTPTPTQTWSAVERDAIAAVDAYKAAARWIENDPAAFTEKQMKALLTKVAGPEVVKANVGSYLDLKKRGFRYTGAAIPLMTVSHGATDVGYATQVIVTRCNDQRGLKAVDKDGREVVPEREKFRIEYWALEEAKLQRLPKPKPLAARVTLIAGGASDAGAAIAERFAAEGACVVLADPDADAAQAVAARLGGTDVAIGVGCDATNAEQLRAAVDAAVLGFGGLDIVVDAAGGNLEPGAAAAVLVGQGLGGDIVYVGAAELAAPAAELGRHGIRVNGIEASPMAPAAYVAGVAFALCTADLSHTTGVRVPVDLV